MTKSHQSPYGAAEKLRRFNEACGPNKLFGTGEAITAAYHILAAGEKDRGYHTSEILDVLGAGIALALEDSFKVQAEEDTE